MTAHDMLSWLGERLEQRLENQAQWHALVDRLEAWRQEAVSAERQDSADRALAFVLARGAGPGWTARDLYDAIQSPKQLIH